MQDLFKQFSKKIQQNIKESGDKHKLATNAMLKDYKTWTPEEKKAVDEIYLMPVVGLTTAPVETTGASLTGKALTDAGIRAANSPGARPEAQAQFAFEQATKSRNWEAAKQAALQIKDQHLREFLLKIVERNAPELMQQATVHMTMGGIPTIY